MILLNEDVTTDCPDIEAECRDDFMKLRVAFNDSFAGLIYSAGELGGRERAGLVRGPG